MAVLERLCIASCTSSIRMSEDLESTIPGPPSKERIYGILYGDLNVT
jgi:hypothetical protein